MDQVENETENGGVKGLRLGKAKAPVISNQLIFRVLRFRVKRFITVTIGNAGAS